MQFFFKKLFSERRDTTVRELQNIGLLWAKVPMFCIESTDVCIKEVRCFCCPIKGKAWTTDVIDLAGDNRLMCCRWTTRDNTWGMHLEIDAPRIVPVVRWPSVCLLLIFTTTYTIQTMFSFSHMGKAKPTKNRERYHTLEQREHNPNLFGLCRFVTEQGGSQACLSYAESWQRKTKARRKAKPTCLDFAMARTDERSMSRDELAQSMPCKEEEDKVKTKEEIQLCFVRLFMWLPMM